LIDPSGNEIGRLTLVRARAVATRDRSANGAITASGNIHCGEDQLEIVELQPESKRPMLLADYRRGNAWTPGMRLESI